MSEKKKTYVIGVDFGSDSVRAIVTDTEDGHVLGSGVSFYPRWKKGCISIQSRVFLDSILLIIWSLWSHVSKKQFPWFQKK